MIDKNRKEIKLDCKKKGIVSTSICEGCFNSKMSTMVGGFYHTRAQCVKDLARRVNE